MDDPCKGVRTPSIGIEIIAELGRSSQKTRYVFRGYTRLLQRCGDRTRVGQRRRRLIRDQQLDLGCRDPPCTGRLLGRAGDQGTRDVVPIFAPFFPGMAGRQSISGFIEEFADQRAAAPGYPSVAGRRGGTELLLDLVPAGAIEDGLVLTGIAGALVRDLPDIDRVRQQRIEGTAREGPPADTGPVPIQALLRSCPLSIDVFLEVQPDRMLGTTGE